MNLRRILTHEYVGNRNKAKKYRVTTKLKLCLAKLP